MFEINSVPTVCTSKMICGWSLFPVGLHGRDLDQRILDKLEALKKSGYFRDFDLLFAIATTEQVEKYRANIVLELAGFQKVFEGDKADLGTQREQDSGALQMWCVKPRDYQAAVEASIKLYKEKLIEVKVDKTKFPMFRLIDLKHKGDVPRGTVLDQCPVEFYQTDFAINAFYNDFVRDYGFDCLQLRKEYGARLTFRQIKDAQNHWKDN